MNKNMKTITRLVPRIGMPPRIYQLLPYEFELTKSMDNCPLEHSHFVAEECRLSGHTIELLLRFTKERPDKSIEECAKELGLHFNGSWRERFSKDGWLPDLPENAQHIKKDIQKEIREWNLSNKLVK